jgi:hypothetical protein
LGGFSLAPDADVDFGGGLGGTSGDPSINGQPGPDLMHSF